MDNLKYKGYIGSVEFSEEDNCLYGKVLGLNKTLISYEGNTVSELKEDFIQGIEQYLEYCKEKNIVPQKSFTGVFNVRIPSEIHSKAVQLAQRDGVSLNSFVRSAIEEKLKSSRNKKEKVN